MVDDNLGDLELFALAVAEVRLPLTVHTASDAVVALSYLSQRGRFFGQPLPHLVVIDINMPRISGLQLLQLLKGSDWRAVPVIIMTTSHDASERSRALTLGATDFLTKPGTWEEYLALLPRLLRYLPSERNL